MHVDHGRRILGLPHSAGQRRKSLNGRHDFAEYDRVLNGHSLQKILPSFWEYINKLLQNGINIPKKLFQIFWLLFSQTYRAEMA